MLATISAPAPVTAILAGLLNDDLCLGPKQQPVSSMQALQAASLSNQAQVAGVLQPKQQQQQQHLISQPSAPQLQLDATAKPRRMSVSVGVGIAPSTRSDAPSKPRRNSVCVTTATYDVMTKPRRNSSSSSVACQTLPLFAIQKLQQLAQQQAQQQQQQQPGACGSPPDASPGARPVPAPAGSDGDTTPPAHSRRVTYSSDSYWNDRYAEKSTHFDWFYSYSALARLITSTCSRQGPCLHVGCGNSGLSDGMAQDGFEVVNVDISPVVIEQMGRMHALPGQRWEVADCRSMPQYADESFASVLDKGTLDAVLCSSHGQADTLSYLNEVHRLLAPGGVFLLISLAQPAARLAALHACLPGPPASLPYLSVRYQQEHATALAAAAAAAGGAGGALDWRWESVRVLLLPKPSLYLASEVSLTGKATAGRAVHCDKDAPVAWLGPYAAGEELDAAIAAQELDLREYFTAFVCTKAGGSGGGDGCAGGGQQQAHAS